MSKSLRQWAKRNLDEMDTAMTKGSDDLRVKGKRAITRVKAGVKKLRKKGK